MPDNKSNISVVMQKDEKNKQKFVMIDKVRRTLFMFNNVDSILCVIYVTLAFVEKIFYASII